MTGMGCVSSIPCSLLVVLHLNVLQMRRSSCQRRWQPSVGNTTASRCKPRLRCAAQPVALNMLHIQAGRQASSLLPTTDVPRANGCCCCYCHSSRGLQISKLQQERAVLLKRMHGAERRDRLAELCRKQVCCKLRRTYSAQQFACILLAWHPQLRLICAS